MVVKSNFNFWECISLFYFIFGDVANVTIIHKLAIKKYEMKIKNTVIYFLLPIWKIL